MKQSAHVDTEFDCAHNLALAQRDSGEVEPALKYFLQDQTIDELLQRTEKNDTRPSHVFGNIGRCLCLKGDIKNALRCVRKSAVMLDTETGSNVLVNQGWAALWLGELFETSGKLDLAYCFFKRAESKWESSSPINAKLSRTRSDKVFDELAKVTSFKLPSDAEIEERCRKLLERGEDVSV